MNKRPKVSSNTIKRLLQYIFHYKLRFFLVLLCIVISALASVASSLYIQTLIDDYITPLLLESNPVFDALLKSIIIMACIYVTGIICTLLYNRIMVSIAQGILKEIRDTMASLRLDSVISSGFRIGRSLACQYVNTGKAAINGLPCEKPDKTISEGDKISVRGLGKIKLERLNGQTKKDRISVTIHRYV